jgi:dUTP pyrophosphatase
MDNLLVKTLFSDARIPCRQSDLAAGYDICSYEDKTIEPGARELISTGISFTVPEGTYGQLAPRSGLAYKMGVHVGAGVIDRDYTGEVKVLLFNLSDSPITINKNDRIAQLILHQIVTPKVLVVEQLMPTLRGTGGFGSTGC